MTTHALAEALAHALAGEARVVQPGADQPVTDAAPDRAAGPGALAWVSPRGLAEAPERARAFRGAFLVVPEGADAAGLDAACTVVASARPKVAFARALGLAFPERIGPQWGAPVHAEARIDPTARLAHGVVVGAGVVVEAGVTVGPNTCLAHVTVERGATLGANCSVGLDGFGLARDAAGALVRMPHVGRVRIGAGAQVGSNTCIDRGALGETVVGAGACIDNLVHVAHNVQIGEGALVIAHAMLGGSAAVGARAHVAPGACVLNQTAVGDDATVGMGAVVIRPVAAGATVVGNPARPLR